MSLEEARVEWANPARRVPVLTILDGSQIVGEVYLLPTSAGTLYVSVGHDRSNPKPGYHPVLLRNAENLDLAVGRIVDCARGASRVGPGREVVVLQLLALASVRKGY